MKETPILLLTGYLGSGKTTLVNKILANRKGIRFAVIVNDIGEVNIDAELIQKGGVVAQEDDSLVALQNGCICCNLKMDLVEQINDLMGEGLFDYIVIEASGICEPGPIAQTLCSFHNLVAPTERNGRPVIDCIASVVDALRLRDEFNSGDDFTTRVGEDDIASLVIQQIEFCNVILLNKASLVSADELEHIEQVIRAIQPKAKIVRCDFCDIELDTIVGTGMFDFDSVATSATWIDVLEHHHEEDEHEHEHHHHHDDHHDHDHEHHHHDHEDHDHHHEHGEHCHCHACQHGHDHNHGDEYGITTFVYYRRRPLNLGMFDEFVARKWPKGVIRTKGMCYFKSEYDICYLFEQAGKQFSLNNAGQWYATMPPAELADMMEQEPGLVRDWDDKYGDRMQKIVFIGQNLDKEAIIAELDKCLEE